MSTRPCDVVLDEHVGTAFGGTATLVGNTIDTNAQECTWTVAGPQLNGTVYITVRYPDPASQNARAADALALMQYSHDFIIETYPDMAPFIEEVAGVGEYAYLNTRTRTIEVAVSPELALSVQFVTSATGDFGTPISDAVRAALAAAALAVAPDLLGA
ncbi:MAG: hypothetical protein Q7V57_12685 [Actinomycetota bacterium]|nr:hypothetical protein [Actinomycetota bacterium]